MSKQRHIHVERTDVGDSVFCDAKCAREFTPDDKESGGFLFGSKAYCPQCAREAEPRIIGYGEQHFIRARCPANKSFRDWVLELRNGNNLITVTTVTHE